MPHKLGDNDKAMEDRLNFIHELIESNDKELSKAQIWDAVKKKGFNVSIATIYNDLDYLASNDQFITDLASKTYSSIMHTAFKRYNKIYELAMRIHDADNHLTRTVETENNNGITNQTIRDTNQAVRLQALTVAKNAADSIRLMVNGENLHISSSKWQQVTKQQQSKIEELRNQIKLLESNNPNLVKTSTD